MHYPASPKELAEARRSCQEMADEGGCSDQDAMRLILDHYDDLCVEVEILRISKQMGAGAVAPPDVSALTADVGIPGHYHG